MAKTRIIGMNSSGNTVGSIHAFGGNSAPQGYLICDGSAVSRTTYSALFAVIGVAHGSGDGSTTFNLPDLRGRFLRGVDGTANKDPDKASRTAMNTGGNTGNSVGSVQGDAYQGHHHDLTGYQRSGGVGLQNIIEGQFGSLLTSNNGFATGPRNDGVNGTPRTTSETRPTNAGVHFIIAYL